MNVEGGIHTHRHTRYGRLTVHDDCVCADGREWCFEPLRPYWARVEAGVSGLWAVLALAVATTFAVRLPELVQMTVGAGVSEARAAVPFAFAAAVGWALATVLALRRPLQHPPRYRPVVTA
jgi:hypothetical protein